MNENQQTPDTETTLQEDREASREEALSENRWGNKKKWWPWDGDYPYETPEREAD